MAVIPSGTAGDEALPKAVAKYASDDGGVIITRRSQRVNGPVESFSSCIRRANP